MRYTFEIFKDVAGEFRVRFKYNGEVMFSSEGYASKQSAMNLISSVKRNAPDAPVEDLTPTAGVRSRATPKKTNGPDAWLIRVTSFGKTFIMSGKMFKSEDAANKAATRLSNAFRTCEAVPAYVKE